MTPEANTVCQAQGLFGKHLLGQRSPSPSAAATAATGWPNCTRSEANLSAVGMSNVAAAGPFVEDNVANHQAGNKSCTWVRFAVDRIVSCIFLHSTIPLHLHAPTCLRSASYVVYSWFQHKGTYTLFNIRAQILPSAEWGLGMARSPFCDCVLYMWYSNQNPAKPPGGLSFSWSLRIASWKSNLRTWMTAWCNLKEPPPTRNCNAVLANLHNRNTPKSLQVERNIEYHRNKNRNIWNMDWKTCVCIVCLFNSTLSLTIHSIQLLCNVLQLHAGPHANAMAPRGPTSGSHLNATDGGIWTFHEWKWISIG